MYMKSAAKRVRTTITVLTVLLIVSSGRECFAYSGASPSPSASGSASSTIPNGPILTGLWKGFAPSLQESVFIAWVKPASSSSNDVLAAIDDTFALVAPKLDVKLYQVLIINVEVEASDSGSTGSTIRGFIFVRDKKDRWTHATDAAIVDKVLQAGLPTSPDADGGVRLSTPLSGHGHHS